MLVLSRKRNESIVITISQATVIDQNGERQLVQFVDPIEVMIVEVRGDNVRLGIKAPKPVPVHRREVYEAINEGEQQKRREQIQRLRTAT